jgi:hypothetical protein
MAIRKRVNPSDSTGEMVLGGATIAIIGTVTLEAPTAVSLLTILPPGLRIPAVEDFIGHRAAAIAAVQSSAHAVLLENKIVELTSSLTEALAVRLKAAGTAARLLADREALARLMCPLKVGWQPRRRRVLARVGTAPGGPAHRAA